MTNRRLRIPHKHYHPGLADKLLGLRLGLGLSQQALATQAGISMPRLSEAERHGLATIETVVFLAGALRLELSELCPGHCILPTPGIDLHHTHPRGVP